MRLANKNNKIFWLLIIFIIAFIFNIIWENAQAPLYAGYLSFQSHFSACFRATLWDAGYVSVLYLSVAGFKEKFFWVEKLRAPDIFIIVLAGFITAIIVEYNALYIGKWSYTETMPVVFGVGLLPLAQLPLAGIVSVWAAQKIKQHLL